MVVDSSDRLRCFWYGIIGLNEWGLSITFFASIPMIGGGFQQKNDGFLVLR